MQAKELYFAPNSRIPQRKKSSDKAGSDNSTKRTSGDKGNATDDSDVYMLKNSKNPRNKSSAKRNDESLTQESEELKQNKIKNEPITFKSYRKQILEKKRMKKKISQERKRELVEMKNSSNGSIRNESDGDKNNISIERSQNTSKLINRIMKMNNSKIKDNNQPDKDNFDSPSSNHIKLDIKYTPNNLNNEVSQEQIKIKLNTKSPKPPKPRSKKNQNESVNSISGSVNLSQLIRDTNPSNQIQGKKGILTEDKPKSEQRKVDVIEQKQPIKIDIKNIKFKKRAQWI